MANARKRGKTWTGQYRDRQGRQKTVSGFETKGEALRAAKDAEKASKPAPAKTGYQPSVVRGGMTVHALSKQYLSGAPAARSTREVREWCLDKYIIPAFGNQAVSAVTNADVRTFLRKLEEGGTKPPTMTKIISVAGSMWQQAIDDELVVKNPWRRQTIVEKQKEDYQIISPEEFEKLLAAIPADWRLLVRLLADSGLRWSEAMALTPSDVKGNVLTVRRSVDRWGTPGPTKNKKPRDVSLPDNLADDLRAALPLRTPSGRPIYSANFRSRVWQPACEAAGFSGFNIHGLRHCHASWLAAGGLSPVEIRDRLGHSSVAITNIYFQSLPDAGNRALKVLADMRA